MSGSVAGQVTGSPVRISPADQNGFLDNYTYNAVLNIDSPWTLSLRDASGATVRTVSGTGTDVNFTWDGKNSSQEFVPDGRYNVSITTTGPSGSVESGYQVVTVDNTLPVAEFTGGLDGTVLAALSSIPITGTATDDNFLEYSLEMSEPATPEVWTPVLVSSDSVFNSNLIIWTINGADGTAPVPDGDYNFRLTVTDQVGHINSDTVQVTIANLRILDVSVEQEVFRPTDGSEIFYFTLNMPADVTLEISTELNEDYVLWKTTIPATTGVNSISWDGTGEYGNLADNDVYSYRIYATDGIREANYDPGRNDSTGQIVEMDSLTSYAPYINDYWKATVDIAGPIRVGLDIISAKKYTPLKDYFSYVFREAGEHTFSWNCRDGRGVASYSGYNGLHATQIDFKPLKINSFFVEGVNPIIQGTGEAPNIEVKSDPYLVHFSYDQLTSLAYTIDMDSHVTVKILPPGRTDLQTDDVVTVVENVLQSAEDNGEPLIQHVTWDGRDIDDIGTNRIGISDEGTFSFVIEATGVVSQMTTTYWGYVNLYK